MTLFSVYALGVGFGLPYITLVPFLFLTLIKRKSIKINLQLKILKYLKFNFVDTLLNKMKYLVIKKG